MLLITYDILRSRGKLILLILFSINLLYKEIMYDLKLLAYYCFIVDLPKIYEYKHIFSCVLK